jgi:hypothetical protein
VEELYSELEMVKLRLKSLQSTIENDFLFNTLNNIRGLILEKPMLAKEALLKQKAAIAVWRDEAIAKHTVNWSPKTGQLFKVESSSGRISTRRR